MMNYRCLHGALVGAFLTVPMLASGCSLKGGNADSEPRPTECPDWKGGVDVASTDFGVDESVRTTFTAFAQASADFYKASGRIVEKVTSACRSVAVGINADSEKDASLTGKTGGELARAWCTLAANQLESSPFSEAHAAGHLTLDYVPPRCELATDEQVKCETLCKDVESCTEPSVEERCEPGEVVGECKGSCEGSCEVKTTETEVSPCRCEGTCRGRCEGVCEGTPETPGTCEGRCDAKCEGKCDGTVNADGVCDGTCTGKCAGKCEYARGKHVNKDCGAGTCVGRCSGRCFITETSGAQCDGACRGSCSVKMTEPRCTKDIKPPVCTTDRVCRESCKTIAHTRKVCTPGELLVRLSVEARGDERLVAIVELLRIHLPKILAALKAHASELSASGEAMLRAGERLVSAPEKLKLRGLGCAGEMGGATAAAVRSVSATFEGSANVVAAAGVETDTK